jgi:hypothetical protein
MKLVDILAAELNLWPDSLGDAVGQASDGTLHNEIESLNDEVVRTREKYTMCKSLISDTVTRAEWQAAVDALNALEFPQESDWPEGSTHYTPPQGEGFNGVFYLVINGVPEKCWPHHGGKTKPHEYQYLSTHAWRSDKTIERKVAPSADWAKGSLPPIGSVVEWDGCIFAPEEPQEKDLHVGDQVTIIAHLKDGDFEMAAFTFNPKIHNSARGPIWVNQGAYGCFRPVRTAEQVAAEERDKAAESLYMAVMDHKTQYWPTLQEHRKEHYRGLVDAGWQKVAK